MSKREKGDKGTYDLVAEIGPDAGGTREDAEDQENQGEVYAIVQIHVLWAVNGLLSSDGFEHALQSGSIDRAGICRWRWRSLL